MKKQTTKKPARNNDQGEMSLLEHLDELRRRLTVAVIALLVGTLAAIAVARPALDLLVSQAENAGIELQAITPTESTVVFFKVALVLGAVIAMPVILYELFQYLRPGLMPGERRYLVVGIPFASLSFAAGAAFAALVALPNALNFLGGFLADMFPPNYSAEKYIGFVSNVMLWTGLIFETPLVMFILARLGIVSPGGFAKARRLVIVGAAIGAAMITPTPDILNMLLIMGPFIILYEFGILLARLAQRMRQRAEQAS
jgi:sec-independent protein translocase protein TatC